MLEVRSRVGNLDTLPKHFTTKVFTDVGIIPKVTEDYTRTTGMSNDIFLYYFQVPASS